MPSIFWSIVISVIFHKLSIFYIAVFLGSVAKHLESANTMFSFIWWIIGFYWVSAGGQTLSQDSPQLYWFVLFHYVIQIVQICFHYDLLIFWQVSRFYLF